MDNSVSPVEIVWTVTALVGLIVCVWAAVDAIADLHYLQALNLNGARKIIAFGAARDETIRVVIQAIFFLIGVVAMLTEPANPDRSVTPLGVLIGGGLCVAVVLLVVKALLGRRDRHRVIEMLAEKDEH